MCKLCLSPGVALGAAAVLLITKTRLQHLGWLALAASAARLTWPVLSDLT